MSAINPASFVTPTAGLPPPGVGALGYPQDSTTDRRHAHDGRNYNLSHLSQTPPNIRESLERGDFSGTNPAVRNAYIDPYQGLGSPVRQHELGSAQGGGFHDPFSSFPSNGYGLLESPSSDFVRASSNIQRTDPTAADWVGGFQGLSLNS